MPSINETSGEGLTDSPGEDGIRVVGGFGGTVRLWILFLFAAGGVVVGALLPLLATWAGRLPWVPFQGPLKLLGSFDRDWMVCGAARH